MAAIYSKPRSLMKTRLIDHVAETYNYLSSKYGDGLHFILAGDTNDLKLDSIINLSPQLKQVVNVITRHNPDAMLDPIFTTLSKFYQSPVAKPPLDNDPNNNGKPSDHNIIVMNPINNTLNAPARKTKIVTFRPLPQQKIQEMGIWITQQSWEEIYDAETAHDKATILQHKLKTALDNYLPEKSIKITSDDQPWINNQIKQIDRKRKREFSKHRKSDKWKQLDLQFKEICSLAKQNYYPQLVKNL